MPRACTRMYCTWDPQGFQKVKWGSSNSSSEPQAHDTLLGTAAVMPTSVHAPQRTEAGSACHVSWAKCMVRTLPLSPTPHRSFQSTASTLQRVNIDLPNNLPGISFRGANLEGPPGRGRSLSEFDSGTALEAAGRRTYRTVPYRTYTHARGGHAHRSKTQIECARRGAA